MAVSWKIKVALLIIGLGLLALVLYVLITNYKKEPFGYSGLTGVPLGDVASYELINPTTNTFADIVSPRGSCGVPCDGSPVGSYPGMPMKAGADVDYRDLLPDVSSATVSYDIDTADPNIFMFRPATRVQLRSPNAMLSDPMRGDLAITKGNCGGDNQWFSSRYGEGDINVVGAFGAFANAQYRSLTGSNNYPINVANEGLIMDFQSAPPASELVQTWY